MAPTELRDLMSQVGSGPKSAEDMNYDQAYSAFEHILSGDADPTALGGFWVANRWKRNTPEELAGFLDAMRHNSVEVASPEAVASFAPDTNPVDCGANYDGKRETALLGVAAGLVSAASGTPVVVHSGDRVPMTEGCAYRHVLSELGVETDLELEDSANMVDSVGFGFYDQSRFNPGVDALLNRRSAVGVRTFINTVETLTNPADATVHLGSFYHLSFAKRIIDTLRESRTSTVERAILFQGLEGYDDIRPGYTKVAEWSAGSKELTDYEIETANYGMSFERDDLEVGDVSADSAKITESVLSGERDDKFADAVALNAAFRIYAGGGAASLEDGLEIARETISDGKSLDGLSKLRRFA
ncbi:anthranilate phosphoribosyltransferase [Haladaptatus litoreus]|uniref:Anthranilate phosphoribosyltransferase n=1 Tax=Haladaptatus litoreus TaxID=553468 RepID=A0A1N6XD93_9EURY|nr:anthranilate phosphoribosyltransferase [Haladaptatus litoreus]SIR00328.1 anthranilate phosphoribosyltransferase [Haladaptatus litoreus]